MAKDNRRFVGTKNFSKNGTGSIELPTDAVIKRIMIHGKINLTTGTNAASGALTDAPYSIIRNMKIDVDGMSRQESSGPIRYYIEKNYINRKSIYYDTVTPPASSSSKTLNFFLPVTFALPWSWMPSFGFFNANRYKNLFLNFTFGSESNLFSTVNDTVVSSIDIDVYVHEILGIATPDRANVFIEPNVLTENLTANNSALEIDLSRGDRDYVAILLRAETATDTPSDTPLSGEIKIEGSGPQIGSFSLRRYKSIDVLQYENEVDLDIRPTAGYGIIDFIGDGNIERNAIGTSELSSWKLIAGVTGGSNYKLDVASLVIKR